MRAQTGAASLFVFASAFSFLSLFSSYLLWAEGARTVDCALACAANSLALEAGPVLSIYTGVFFSFLFGVHWDRQ